MFDSKNKNDLTREPPKISHACPPDILNVQGLRIVRPANEYN